MNISFYDVKISVNDNEVIINRGNKYIQVYVPCTKFEGYRIVRGRYCLRDFESKIFDDNAGIKRDTEVLVMTFKRNGDRYVVYIVKWIDGYHVLHGWSWFDGDKYGFYHIGVLQ